MRIIPAIDLIDGKCVRLTKGNYSTKKIYNENPLEVAKSFVDHGIKYLHLVDLDGAKARKPVNLSVLEEISSKTGLEVDFGGGLQAKVDLTAAFEYGATKVNIGSTACQNPDLFLEWLAFYGPEKIILAADCMHRKIAVQSWSDTSEVEVMEYISNYHKKGVENVVCTDIAKDGMLQGPSTQLYEEILAKSPVKLVASGGISSIADVEEMKRIGCEATIIGKAIYEGKISLKELQALC